MLNVPYEPAVSVCAVVSARIVITDRQCAARAQAGVFRPPAPHPRRASSDDRRIVGAVDLRHRDVMLCATSADVTVKVSVNVSPSLPALELRPGRYSRVRPHAIGADVERAVWACRVSLRREGRFARIVITDRQCAARAQAGVFRHFARIRPSCRSDDRRIIQYRWSSPWCHALCRLPTSLWRFR